jgi:hypothetical protein
MQRRTQSLHHVLFGQDLEGACYYHGKYVLFCLIARHVPGMRCSPYIKSLCLR